MFHTFSGYIPGGFTGVDIFFVISGYLITGIILAENRSGHFSLMEFWMRRCRRILPALFFMLAAVTIVAGWLLLPSDLSDYGGMLASTVVFIANGYLAQDHGYFHPAFLDNPILHTWSLSVEEQYYLVWPVLFSLLLFKLRRSYAMAIILALLLGSLIYSQWAVVHDPRQGFFSIVSRTFELLIGGSLAIVNPGPMRSRLVANLLASGGLLSIGTGLVSLSETTPFPGLAALLPCLGAALLIRSGIGGTQTWVKSLLSSPPFVSIGKISYSWYLWHWPPLAFAHYYFGRPLTTAESLALAGLGLSIAIFSWRFVETPFRKQMPVGVFRRRALPGIAAAAVTFLALGGSFLFWDGMSWRLSAEGRGVQRILALAKTHEGCSEPVRRGYVSECKFGAPSAGEPTVLLWGDSHADHYIPALARIAEANDISGVARTRPGCQPFFVPISEVQSKQRDKCRVSNAETINFLKSHPEIDTVILASRWSVRHDPTTPPADLAKLEAAFDTTLRELANAGKHVVLLGEPPLFPNSLDSCLLRQIEFGFAIPNCRSIAVSSLDQFQTMTWSLLDTVQQKYRDVTYFAPQTYLCDASHCRAVDAEGRPLYNDDNHLNPAGAYFLQSFLQQALRPAFNLSKLTRGRLHAQEGRS